MRIKARNHGQLPDAYKAFEVQVSGDGVRGTASIPASADVSNTGKVVLDLTQGDRRIEINWTNDIDISDEIGSSIEIEGITLKRVGDSERSGLAAFLLHSGQSRAIVFGLIAVLAGALGVLLFSRLRRRA